MAHPAPPHPLLFFNRLPLLPTILLFFHKHRRLLGFILSLLISVATCAYALLSWYAFAGGGAAPSPLHPPTRFYFLTGSPCYLLFFCFFMSIIVCLGSFYLCWYPSPLVPMHFFLGTHCGGRRCALPLHPPTRFFIFLSASLVTYCLSFFISIVYWGYLLFLNLY